VHLIRNRKYPGQRNESIPDKTFPDLGVIEALFSCIFFLHFLRLLYIATSAKYLNSGHRFRKTLFSAKKPAGIKGFRVGVFCSPTIITTNSQEVQNSYIEKTPNAEKIRPDKYQPKHQSQRGEGH